jgi:phage terminase large subunit-like protein
MKKDFGAIATQYAQDVVDGKIISSKYQRLACQRHLNDLEKSKKSDYLYEFNPELIDFKGKTYRPGQRICAFIEKLPHIKGDWAKDNKLIILEPWQVFVLAGSFGWIVKATGKRRFTAIDLFVARKNGKSAIAAGIGLYLLTADGEYGAEVYSGATSKDQAFEVFAPAKAMTEKSLEFKSYYGVIKNKENLAVLETNSFFEPLTGNPGDGASPSGWIVDEYHEHKTSELYDTGETGMGARSQPILLMITTAGANIGGPCYNHQRSLQDILDGVRENDRRFGIIFGIDPDDDWTTEEALRKANPNYDISVSGAFLLAQIKEALADPRKQSTVQTKHLNMWVASASPWLNLQNLQKCGDKSLKVTDFLGESCYIGLDLASKQDIASKVIEFEREIDGKKHYYAFSTNYLPEAAVQRPENSHYRGWVAAGHLIETPGNMTDLNQIQEDILDDVARFGVNEVAKDPYGGHQLGSNLAMEGVQVVDVPQRVAYLSDPMKDLAALVDAGQFHHDGNPAFVWMLANVEVKPDNNENIFPRKQSPDKKTDAAIGLIVSHGRMMRGEKHDTAPGIFVLG